MSDPKKYTVGWISAIVTEYVAAQQFLEERHEGPKRVHQKDENHYTLGRIGKHNIVIAVLPQGDNGVAAAAMAAKDMMHTFPNVRVGLMVGIGGGVPSKEHDIRLGDVVISTPSYYGEIGNNGGVVQYDYAQTMQKKRFQSARYLNQPPRALRAAVAGLRARHINSGGNQIDDTIRKLLQRAPQLQEEFSRPDPTSDRLYSSEIIQLERATRRDNTAVHYGLIASADHFMEDASVRDILAKELDVLCFEMEAAGLMNQFPCLIIRGICDYSDTQWSKEWRGFAALAAAAYAKDLLYEVAPMQLEAEEGIGELLYQS
ncbi:nucleoside phosphorylase domain-containing protein [Fusarium tricinctum]|uniref:Nucleoside phosphorylase domain-containing protein n=1 Tax=Fusarium tricinctum TaxID=61284 RepID=A0A8K0RVZ5_9HYPO|nr:nucleoside phosphorylase domain-containing protein [Fusarium tricinctum]